MTPRGSREGRTADATLVSVVVPVWNGEHNLGRLLPRLAATLASTIPGPTEVIVALPPDDPVAGQVRQAGARGGSFGGIGYGHALNAGLAASQGRGGVPR